ncbi:small conductance mechanosensitive channel [Malonomonas rubra DSM 5091]|uniref:Small conductance mechanosensitive channel n=1 Tax=Malonomonas rubra DSM 5091 TaxID=1122189 RepID=A0A1M6KZG4_MALRU|nr:mechanosensitive ion channel family protein [Malonomonas rubra]SHJ64262.1 small conductance mechanosensitive channel [Malonomonas rubra DSM 5091]
MDIIEAYVDALNWKVLINSSVRIFLILLILLVAMRLMKALLNRLEKRLIQNNQAEDEPLSEASKRVGTLIKLVRQAASLALWIVLILVILKELGVDIAPILAGAGILGLAVGFGAQNLVRDVISGFFFILENQVRVGDVAVINGTGGLVDEVNFRTIVLRDLTGTVHVFPNGTVSTLSNMTHTWSAWVFDVGVAYKEDTDRVIELIKQVGRELREDPVFRKKIIEDIEVFGVNKFGDSAVEIKGRIKTRPIEQWAVGREFQRRLKYLFDEQGIEIPFPHLTVYRGEESRPFEVELYEKLKGKVDC